MTTPVLNFANGAASTRINKPPDQVIDQGFNAGEVVPQQTLNWLMQKVGGSMAFAGVAGAVQELLPGMTAVVNEADTSASPLDLVATSSVGSIFQIITNSRYIILWIGTDLVVLNRDTLAIVRTLVAAGTAGQIATDGKYVYRSDGTDIEGYEIESGVLRFTVANTQNVETSDGRYIYTRSGSNAYAIDATTGAAVWGPYSHNATIRNLRSNGQQLFLIGSASGHASTATVRAIEAATGKDAANEGTLGASTEPWVWDSAPAGLPPSAISRVRFDGSHVYVTGSDRIQALNAITGALIREHTGLASPGFMTVDHRYIYHSDGTAVHVYSKGLDSLAYAGSVSATAASMIDVASDGSGLYIADQPGSGPRVVKINMPNPQPTRYLLTDPEVDFYRVFPNLLLQPLGA